MSRHQIKSSHGTEDALNFFEKCKNKLTSSALLACPIMHGKLHLACDASEKAIGSCLNQFDPETKTWRPLAYYSKALSSSQRQYSTYDRELLALFLSVRHFCDLLLGRDVTLVTDHKPLTFAMEKVSPANYVPSANTPIKLHLTILQKH